MKRLSITYRAVYVCELLDFSTRSTGAAVIEEAQSGCVTFNFPTLLPHFYGSVLVRIPFALNQKNPEPTVWHIFRQTCGIGVKF